MIRIQFKVVVPWVLWLLAGLSVHAANVWDGGGANNNWDTANNWDNNIVPAAGNNLTFGTAFTSGTAINLNGNRTVGTLTVNTATGITFSNNVLTVNGGTITVTQGNHTINSAVTLGANTTFDIQGTATLTINGVVSGGFNVIKAGSGTLVFNAANSYTGTTAINVGTLQLGNATGLGTTGSGTTIASGATLDLNGQAVGAENITNVTGTGVGGNGAIVNTSATAASHSGTIALTGTTAVGGSAGTLTLSGVISGAQQLTKVGNDTLILTGTNTYSGVTNFNGGTVRVASLENNGTNGPLGSNNYTFNGGTLEVTATDSTNRTAVLNAGGGAIDVNSGATVTLSGVISGTGALTKTDAGTLLPTATNTYTGVTNFNGGVVRVGSLENNGTSGPLGRGNFAFDGGTLEITATDSTNRNITLNAGGGTFDINNGTTTTLSGIISGAGSLIKSDTGTLALTTSNNTFGGVAQSVFINAGMLTIDSDARLGDSNNDIFIADNATLSITAASSNLPASRTITLGAGSNQATIQLPNGTTSLNPIVINGKITGSNNLRFSGNSDAWVRLSNTTSDFVGQVQLIQATNLMISDDRALGNSANGVSMDRFNVLVAEATLTTNRPIVTTNTGGAEGGGLLALTGVTFTATNVVSGNGGLFTGYTGTGQANFNGTVQLQGNNTYTGVLRAGHGNTEIWTNVNDSANGAAGNSTSAIQLGSSNFNNLIPSLLLGTAGITVAKNISVGNGRTTTPTLGGSNTSGINTISGNVTINTGNLTNSTLTLTQTTAGAITNITGVISQSAPTAAVVKSGAGIIELSNANTYTGTTTINAGDLRVSNTTGSATGTGAVTVNTTGTLSGAGIITGTVNVNAGTVSPGGSSPGVLTIGALTNSSTNSTFAFRLGAPAQSPSAPVNSDRIAVNGALTMSSAGNITFSTGAGFSTGTYTLFTYTSGAAPADTSFPVTTALPSGYDGYISTSTAGQVNLVVVSATPVTLRSFNARGEGLGVYLEWETASELQNLGFNVYRRRAFNPEARWERMNDTMIPGRLTKQDAKTYRWFDFGEGYFEYRLESISLLYDTEQFPKKGSLLAESGDGSRLTDAGRLALQEKLERDAKKKLAQELIENIPPGVEPIAPRHSGSGGLISFFLPNTSNLSTKLPSGDPVQDFLAAPTLTPFKPLDLPKVVGPGAADRNHFAKIVYHNKGVMKVSADKLPKGYESTKLYLEREGKMARALGADASGVVLWSPGYEDLYTDRDVFFGYQGVGATPVQLATPAPGAKVTTGFKLGAYTQTEVYRDQYVDSFFDLLTYTPWFSSKILWENNAQTFPIQVSNLGTSPGALTLNLYSYYGNANITPDHNVQVFVNGTHVGGSTFDGDKAVTVTVPIPAGLLHNGENLVDLVVPPLDNYPHEDWEYTQISFVHGMSLTYARELKFEEAQTNLAFRTLQPGTYEVQGLPGPKAWVVDVTDANAVQLLGYRATSGTKGYTLRFNAGSLREIWVVPEGREYTPISVTPRDFRYPSGKTDYVAVGPAMFGEAVDPLLKERQKQGLKTTLLDQEDLFDAYNFGRYGPEGIRGAMVALKPEYLLLLGRPTYDFNNYEGKNLDPLCPTFLVHTQYVSQAASDSKFGDLGKGYPEIAVGRFPVRSVDELKIAVQRTLEHRTNYGYGLQSMLVADRGDDFAGNFAEEAESIANNVQAIEWSRAYLGVNTDSADTVRTLIETAVNNQEVDNIIYVGHGSSERWSLEDILTMDTAGNWTGNAVLLQASCNGNYFLANQEGTGCMAGKLLTQESGGISLSISTTTYLASKPAVDFMAQVLKSTGKTWGKKVLSVQQSCAGVGPTSLQWYQDLMWSECILGDPALPVLDDSARPKK